LEAVAEASPGWKARLDLLRGALDAWTRPPDGSHVAQQLTKLAAGLMVLPLIFLISNLLNEITGNEEVVFEAFFQSWLGTALVVGGPFAAAALVLIPAMRLSVAHRQEGPAIGLSLHLGRVQLIIALGAVVIAGILVGYAFVENFVPRGY
jgi:hypothetical protein